MLHLKMSSVGVNRDSMEKEEEEEAAEGEGEEGQARDEGRSLPDTPRGIDGDVRRRSRGVTGRCSCVLARSNAAGRWRGEGVVRVGVGGASASGPGVAAVGNGGWSGRWSGVRVGVGPLRRWGGLPPLFMYVSISSASSRRAMGAAAPGEARARPRSASAAMSVRGSNPRSVSDVLTLLPGDSLAEAVGVVVVVGVVGAAGAVGVAVLPGLSPAAGQLSPLLSARDLCLFFSAFSSSSSSTPRSLSAARWGCLVEPSARARAVGRGGHCPHGRYRDLGLSLFGETPQGAAVASSPSPPSCAGLKRVEAELSPVCKRHVVRER